MAFLLFLGSMNALYAIAWALWGNSRHSVGYFNGKSWCFPLVYSFSAGSSNGVIVMSTLPIRTVPSRRAPKKTASVFFVFMVFLLSNMFLKTKTSGTLFRTYGLREWLSLLPLLRWNSVLPFSMYLTGLHIRQWPARGALPRSMAHKCWEGYILFFRIQSYKQIGKGL